MNADFNDLSSKEHLKQARYLLVAAAICSPVFYYFMKSIETQSTDSLYFRMLITIVSLLSFIATFIKTKHQTHVILFVSTLVRILYLILYLYLLHINQWTIYQRWSYFVLAFIACGSTFSWREYLGMTSVTIGAPIILGFYSSGISSIELIHFHVANFATLFIIGVAIHAQYRFKKEIYKLTQELVSKSQMAALGEVTAGISHEMNSPIMVLSNSLLQLKRHISSDGQNQADSKKVEELLSKMHRMIERISIIANALKIYSHDKKDQLNDKVNIFSFVENSLNSFSKNTPNSGVQITLNNQASAYCYLDQAQMHQCLIHLLNNAIEACRNQPQPHVTVTINLLDSFVYISISDNGNGVSKEIINKIMQPFFTTKEIGDGMGLGLSVALGIARIHNGDLFLDDSSPMTTFVLKLPVTT